jgi:hypothetical protein
LPKPKKIVSATQVSCKQLFFIPATALLLKKRRRAEYRLPPHSKFFRQTCEAPGGTSVCLPGGGHAAVSPKKLSTLNVQLSTLNFQRAGTPAPDGAHIQHALDSHDPRH